MGLSNIGVREYSIREGADRDFTMKNLLGLRIALTGVAVVIAVVFAAAAGYPAVMVVGTMVAAIGFVLTTVQHSLGVPLSAGLRLSESHRSCPGVPRRWRVLTCFVRRGSCSRSSCWC